MLSFWLLLALLPARGCVPGGLCTCAILPPERAYGAAEMVFTAVVEGGQPFGVPEELRGVVRVPDAEPWYDPVHLRVTEQFKGVRADTLTVRAGGSCRVHFTAGEEYLVYVHRQDGILSTNFCVGSRLLTTADADLPVLRALAREPRRAESGATSRASAVPAREVRR